MKEKTWIVIGALCGCQIFHGASVVPVRADALPVTNNSDTSSSKGSSNSAPTTAFDSRLYTEDLDARAFEQINSLYSKADVFLYCKSENQIGCQYESRNQKFVENPDEDKKFVTFTQAQLLKLLRARVDKNLLVVQLPEGVPTSGTISPQSTQKLKEHLEKLLGLFKELDFERVLVFVPQIGLGPANNGVCHIETKGYFIMMDQIKSKN